MRTAVLHEIHDDEAGDASHKTYCREKEDDRDDATTHERECAHYH